jgi:hypothetical protein
MPSILEQYPISDFLEWHQKKTLILNPHFQRRSIWTPVARSYLIDTILRQMPIPKIYLRTKIEVRTRKTIREVVDGQQAPYLWSSFFPKNVPWFGDESPRRALRSNP